MVVKAVLKRRAIVFGQPSLARELIVSIYLQLAAKPVCVKWPTTTGRFSYDEFAVRSATFANLIPFAEQHKQEIPQKE
jgi:hypothetical protein